MCHASLNRKKNEIVAFQFATKLYRKYELFQTNACLTEDLLIKMYQD